MEKILYEILDKDKQLLASNIPPNFNLDKTDLKNKIKTTICPISGKKIRHGLMETNNGIIYLVSYDIPTNKIFKRYFEACNFFIPIINININSQKEKIQTNFRRFKHNLVTHHTNINQELEAIFPISNSNSHGATEQIDFIIKQFEKDKKNIAISILKIIKSSNLMKAEFDVYDMISSKNPSLEFYSHSPHKLVYLVISPFWLEFVEKGIRIEIKNCKENVYVDYRSISVILSNILENTSKYTMPNTDLIISFEKTDKYIFINFEMISLQIESNEINEIIKEGISGNLAKKLNLAGNGIGLSMVNKLIKLNKGELIIKTNTDAQSKTINKGIPYEKNIFTLKLPRALHNTVYSS